MTYASIKLGIASCDSADRGLQGCTVGGDTVELLHQ